MAKIKLYKVVGTSSLDGETKLRFSNDTKRGILLKHAGHTDIKMIELSVGMTRYQAVQFIEQFVPEFDTEEQMTAIIEYLEDIPADHIPFDYSDDTEEVEENENDYDLA